MRLWGWTGKWAGGGGRKGAGREPISIQKTHSLFASLPHTLVLLLYRLTVSGSGARGSKRGLARARRGGPMAMGWPDASRGQVKRQAATRPPGWALGHGWQGWQGWHGWQALGPRGHALMLFIEALMMLTARLLVAPSSSRPSYR